MRNMQISVNVLVMDDGSMWIRTDSDTMNRIPQSTADFLLATAQNGEASQKPSEAPQTAVQAEEVGEPQETSQSASEVAWSDLKGYVSLEVVKDWGRKNGFLVHHRGMPSRQLCTAYANQGK